MKKINRSPIVTVTIYALIFILGVIVGNQILIPTEPIQQLAPLPVQNYSASANILAVKAMIIPVFWGKLLLKSILGREEF